MTKQIHAQEDVIGRTLIAQAEWVIPEDTDVWPTVQQYLSKRPHTVMDSRGAKRPDWLRRTVVVTTLASAIVTAGGVTAAAASPQVRIVMHHAVAAAAGIVGLTISASTDGNLQTTGGFSISPVPPFRYAELTTIPTSLTQHAFGYMPASQPRSVGATGIAIVPEQAGAPVPQESQDLPHDGPYVWLRFTAPSPGMGYLEVVERPSTSGYSLPSGETLSIGGNPAIVEQQGDRTTVTLARLGTTVMIRTNVGRDVAINGAEALNWH